ncbi:MAG TPA: K(+)-transporting ATPase subunit C, partial [Ilumatobacteraceae bacterium]|nr:K(+)-transporting ATPase subunit C [Ilumatobacteraceae bacterium]
GLIYPLLVTGIGQVAFGGKADGSLIHRDGKVVASSLIGQPFSAPIYFHPRPSAAGDGYDATASGGSNLGPTSAQLLDLVSQRVAAYRSENSLADNVTVPVDAVTASGSGFDPHISVANALLQAPRIAAARGVDVATVRQMVAEHTADRMLGVLGEPGVNVVELNLALDGR